MDWGRHAHETPHAWPNARAQNHTAVAGIRSDFGRELAIQNPSTLDSIFPAGTAQIFPAAIRRNSRKSVGVREKNERENRLENRLSR